MQENLSGLSIQSVDNEDGVKKVYIVRISDGVVLAPPSLAGTVPDIPFIQSARRDIRSFTAEVDLSTIGASFPIGAFDPNTGEQSVRALAIVFYDIGSISFDDARLLSLLFQTLLLSLIVGGIVFYFLYKLIEYPISNLNEQLDRCMREQRDDLQTNLIFPTYQHLISNVNSLLTRSLSSSSGSMGPIGGVNKHGEAENIVQLMGFPCATISNENKIISANSNFCQVARVAVDKMTGKGLEIIPDRAFQQNLEGLISRSRETPESILNDQLEFSGHNFLLSCATFRSGATQIDYFLVSISPLDRESEGGTG